MILACKIPLRFDPGRLGADLGTIAASDWTPHFNTREYVGDWSGVALRVSARAGAGSRLLAGLNAGSEFVDTPILDRCPYFREVLSAFRCPLKSARLLKLGAGASILEHRDYDLGLDDGEARVHIPVATNAMVEFLLDGRRVIMNEGEAWYLELNRRHSVRNRGATDRVHLVVDCIADDWFHSRLAAGDAGPNLTDDPPAAPRGFDAFRELVLRDRSLQETLAGTKDRRAFIALVERLGRENDFVFNESDVEDALRDAQRVWIERFIR
jgi:hypothetical protein